MPPYLRGILLLWSNSSHKVEKKKKIVSQPPILIQWWQEVLRGIGIFEVCILELPVDSLLGLYQTPNYPILKEALKGQGKSEDTAILKFASFSIVGAWQNHWWLTNYTKILLLLLVSTFPLDALKMMWFYAVLEV